MCRRVVAGLALFVIGSNAAYSCTSDVSFTVSKSTQKGLALDDTTLHWCPDQIPSTWPNTNEAVSSIRVFKAWESDWQTDKNAAWKNIADFLQSTNTKALVGTQISCNESDDEAEWAEVSSLLKLFGQDHIMGVAIGNELDLLWQEGASADCISSMWSGKYFQNKFNQRVQQIDAMFPGANIPVTSIFSEFSLAGNPFVDDPAKAMVNTFLSNATKAYAGRFAFSLNLYPYFDMSNQYFNVTAAIARSSCFDGPHGTCLFSDVTKDMRTRMRAVVGSDDGKLWIAETGWSSPASSVLKDPMKSWPDYSSHSAFKTTYENFLNWDMTFADGSKGPDHVFYFTMRDAPAFGGLDESFGLVGDELGNEHLCQEQKCKIQSSDSALALVV